MINPWLKLADASVETQVNLLCFPFAGGYAEYFLPWRQHLPRNVSLIPVQLPGRSSRWQEPQLTDMDTLQQVMVPALTPLLYEKPYYIFGHSMGGYIAYEFVRSLLQKGLPAPVGMMVSAIPAPRHWQARRAVSAMSIEEFRQFFIALGGFPEELLKHESFIQMQMNLLRNDIILCESCRYAGAADFTFPLTALGGDQDEYVEMISMQGWADETSGQFELHEKSGNHFYLNQHLPSIIELIRNKVS